MNRSFSVFSNLVSDAIDGAPSTDYRERLDGAIECVSPKSLGFSCAFCGVPAWVGLLECWGHEFEIAASCEHAHEAAVAALADVASGDSSAELLSALDGGALVGETRRLADTGSGLIVDYGITIRPISRSAANAFIVKHHQHNGALPGDRFRGAIWNGPTMIGVVVVGNPCARAFNHKAVEVRRLCLDFNVSDALRYKAASSAYAWAASVAEDKGWPRIITYTLESETGLSLRYARWKRVGPAGSSRWGWNTPSRRRAAPAHDSVLERKVLWEKLLSPSPEAVAARLRQTA